MDEIENLPENIRQALHRCKFTSLESILHNPASELELRTNLSASDVKLLKQTVAEKLLFRTLYSSAWELLKDAHHTGRLSTGCPILDGVLQGGISSKGITEISGESGAGKTQICLQLSLAIQVSINQYGHRGGVAYICTEDAFPVKRLNQLISQRFTKHKDKIAFSDNIYIEHVEDVKGLVACLSVKLPTLIDKRKIQLLIIDSIAAPFRCEYDKEDAMKRAKVMYEIAENLHMLNTHHKITTVCINQVTSEINAGNEGRNVPSLGLSWANIVNTRIVMSKVDSGVMKRIDAGILNNSTNSQLRLFKITFSPDLPPSSCYCRISSNGVDAIDCTV